MRASRAAGARALGHAVVESARLPRLPRLPRAALGKFGPPAVGRLGDGGRLAAPPSAREAGQSWAAAGKRARRRRARAGRGGEASARSLAGKVSSFSRGPGFGGADDGIRRRRRGSSSQKLGRAAMEARPDGEVSGTATAGAQGHAEPRRQRAGTAWTGAHAVARMRSLESASASRGRLGLKRRGAYQLSKGLGVRVKVNGELLCARPHAREVEARGRAIAYRPRRRGGVAAVSKTPSLLLSLCLSLPLLVSRKGVS
ncbi:hypothetical protein CDD83_721 [Cordyceps sp. RAO-2017]|nr:hypothetical protein CDD83_721 [Cordyceps sp. RAO-2017]